MFKNRKKALSLLVTLFFIAIFAWYVSANWSRFQEISFVNPWLSALAAVLVMLNLYGMGMLFELAIKPHGVNLSRNEIFGLSALTRFSKQIMPAYLGATIRAVYLKKNYNVSYAKFSSSFLLSNVLQLIISGIIALAIYLFYEKTLLNSQPIIAVSLIVLFFLLLIYGPVTYLISFLKSKTQKNNSKIIERLMAASEYFDKLRSQPKLIASIFFWMLIVLAISSATIFSLYHSLGQDMDVLPAIFISALVSWSMVFSITPAGIGVREGLMVVGAGLMSVPIPETLAVSILLRLITFVVVSGLSAYYAPRLLNTTISNLGNIS